MNIEGIIKLEKSVFGKNYQSMQKSECESLKNNTLFPLPQNMSKPDT